MSDTHNPQQNRLLGALSPESQKRLSPHLKPVSFPLGLVVYESGHTLSHVYFPIDSIVSLLYVMENGLSAEISLVGHAGRAPRRRHQGCRQVAKAWRDRIYARADHRAGQVQARAAELRVLYRGQARNRPSARVLLHLVFNSGFLSSLKTLTSLHIKHVIQPAMPGFFLSEL